MKEFDNKVNRYLEHEEHEAVLKCAKILEEAFGKKIYRAVVNSDNNDQETVWGVAFSFDKPYKGKSYKEYQKEEEDKS